MTEQVVRRGFHRYSKAWYALYVGDRAPVEDVMFGDYPEGGGTRGEMAMRWYDIVKGKPFARLEAFSDSWATLATFGDVIAVLAGYKTDPTPDEFCAALELLGFVDLTATEKPK